MDKNYSEYSAERRAHWDQIAVKKDTWRSVGVHYHTRLNEIFKTIVPKNSRVLEIGCGKGQLLAYLQPSFGVGIDFSTEMVQRSAKKYPNLHFLVADAHSIPLQNLEFDYIILSDLLNDLWDIQTVLEVVHRLSGPHTRIVINFFSRVWQPVLNTARFLGLATPLQQQNWITIEDTRSLLKLTNFEIIQTWREILLPLPLIGRFFNKIVVKLWPFNQMALTNIIIFRPIQKRPIQEEPPLVSVIVPARNETEHIDQIFQRTPKLGRETELIFVEGHSKDDTYQVIEKSIQKYPEVNAALLKQTGNGKGDAVRLGFSQARGDILMILDADMTVPPEDLERFYLAITQNKGEFINGVRLVYPMEDNAMRMMNLIGNKFFSIVFSWLLGQTIRDTLCGTKVLWKKDYETIAANRSYFGTIDPFGDFDLLLGAAKIHLKILEIPIRYRERKFGTTQIHRWKHGMLLLRMALLAAKKIKFI